MSDYVAGTQASIVQLMILQDSVAVATTTMLVVAATEAVAVVSGVRLAEHRQQVCSFEAALNWGVWMGRTGADFKYYFASNFNSTFQSKLDYRC